MFYKKHLFFCVNLKESGQKCCGKANAEAICLYAKRKLKELKVYGKSGVRVSSSGCMGRCADGPALVVYPDAVWYTYHDEHDIDEIIEKYIINDQVVEQLLIKEP